jgi:hypothetical protein
MSEREVSMFSKRLLFSAIFVLTVLTLSLGLLAGQATPTSAQGPGRHIPFVQVITPISMDKDLRDLPFVPSAHPPGFKLNDHRRHGMEDEGEGHEAVRYKHAPLNLNVIRVNMPSTSVNFDGIDLAASLCGCSPPDTDGDVGASNYIQAVNVAFEIWDKTGTVLQATTTFNTLWGSGGSNPCTNAKHFGDPFVFYDHVADRWVLTDFAFGTAGPNTVPPYYECIAVSKTSDPVSGGWWLYAIQADTTNTDWLNDYPKFGMWPDAWYVSYNMFCGAASCTYGGRNSFQGVEVVAFDRSTMLTGGAATSVQFILSPTDVADSYTFIPANYRFGAPPNGRNEFFAAIDSPAVANWNVPLTKVHIWKFHVDFTTPANSTFAQDNDVTVNSFINAWDSTESGNIVPQSGTATKLDTVGDRLFTPLWYQNLSGTESLWASHTISTTSTGNPTAIRWYQFNVTGNTVVTTPVQQGEITGTSLYRLMPSLSLDSKGDMAIGYTSSSSSSYPTIRYNGRLVTDTLGTLSQGESILMNGTGPTSSTRWGDYSYMSIDPSDGCTFWHTNEYMSSASTSNWRTRVGAFTYPYCTGVGTLQGTVTDASTSNPISGATVVAGANSTTTNASGVYQFANINSGTYTVTASKTGYDDSSAGVVITTGSTITQNFALTSCTTSVKTWIGLGNGGADTNFNTASNWSPSGAPTACNDVIITVSSGATILVSADATVNSITLTNNTGGGGANLILDVQTSVLTAIGTFSGNNASTGSSQNNLMLRVGNSPGSFKVNGNFNFGTSGNASAQVGWQGSAAGNTTGSQVFGGNVNTGAQLVSFISHPGNYIFDASGTQTVTTTGGDPRLNASIQIGSANAPTVILSLASTSALAIYNASDGLTVSSNAILDLTTKTLNKSNTGGTLTLNSGATLKLAASTGGQTGSNFPLNFTTFSLNASSTVEYNAAGGTNQTIFATPTYGHLKLMNGTGSGSTIKTATAALTIAGNLTIGSNATFAAGTSLTHNLAGSWTNNGTFSFTTGNIISFTGNSSAVITGSSTTAFSNITVNKGSSTTTVLEATGLMSMSGNLTLMNGLFKLTHASATAQFGGSATIASTAGLQINGGTLNGSNGTITNNGLVRVTSGSATFGTASGNAVANQTGSTFDMQGGTATFSGRLVATGGAITITGGVITVCTAGNTLSGTGSFDMSATTKLSMSGGSVIFQNASSASTPQDLVITGGSGAKSITGGTFQIGNTSTPVSQAFKLNSAAPIYNLAVNGTNSPTGRLDTLPLTVTGNITINAGGTLDAATNNLNLLIGGNWTNNGTFLPGSATVTFNGIGAQVIGGSNTTVFNHLTITNSVSGVTAPSGNLNIAGNFTNNGTFNHGFGTVTFNGTGAQTIGGSSTAAFNNLTITNNIGGVTAPSGNLNVAGDFTNNGTFSHSFGAVTFNGTGTQTISGSSTTSFNHLTIMNTVGSVTAPSGNLNIAGNFTNNGTFNHGSGTVIFKGAVEQSISGSSPIGFNNMTVVSDTRVVIPDTNPPTVAVSLTVQVGSALKQTRTVSNATVSFLQISTDKYRGVDLATPNNLGSTTVIISTTASSTCPTTGNGSPPYAHRCYSITPTTNTTATVKLWALTSELNGILESTLVPYHYSVDTWVQLTNLSTGNDSGSYAFAQGDTPGFSPFLLGGPDAPTAITLSEFSATSTSNGYVWLLATSSVLALLIAGWRFRQRVRN